MARFIQIDVNYVYKGQAISAFQFIFFLSFGHVVKIASNLCLHTGTKSVLFTWGLIVFFCLVGEVNQKPRTVIGTFHSAQSSDVGNYIFSVQLSMGDTSVARRINLCTAAVRGNFPRIMWLWNTYISRAKN